MKLSEAYKRGRAKVPERCKGAYSREGGTQVCFLGAAMVGTIGSAIAPCCLNLFPILNRVREVDGRPKSVFSTIVHMNDALEDEAKILEFVESMEAAYADV